jgi:hypothetical protein
MPEMLALEEGTSTGSAFGFRRERFNEFEEIAPRGSRPKEIWRADEYSEQQVE